MDYIEKFDIELEKECYYAGEILKGNVVIVTSDNLKVRGIRVFLRGKAHVEWRITRSGERRTVKEDQYYIDEKATIWGKEKGEDLTIPIMPRGQHRYPFSFQLPESALPCSFESKLGTIRYYLRVIIDIPYASTPQGLKYFTIIGPHIDCMDDRYLASFSSEDQQNTCCLCCHTGPISLQATIVRSAYCCGENLKLKAVIQNGSDRRAWLKCYLLQFVEYHISKGVLGLTKEVRHTVWDYKGPPVAPHTTIKLDKLSQYLQVPVVPPTIVDVCKLMQMYYVLRVSLLLDKRGEDLVLDFPVTIATVPYRISNSGSPEVRYENSTDIVEGGMYISPEFQLGQVYDGTAESETETVLYKPVYVCVPHQKMKVTNTNVDPNDPSQQVIQFEMPERESTPVRMTSV